MDRIIVLLLIMYVAIFAQIIIHEAGHLIFGLVSGYQFSSFRIFSFMWVKENGRIRLRRLSVAGTGGQCLMAPPDMVDGKIPLVLYNLGGSLMNFISAIVCLGLYFAFDENRFLSVAMLMSAVMGVLAANRFMDAHEFAEAKKLISHLLGIDTGMVGVHRSLMICDRIYLELVGDGHPKVIEKLYTKDLQKFMKSMKNYPSILRTQYVYALLYEKDRAKAEKVKGRFEKCAKTYPYPNDIQSERELMELAEERMH